QRAVVVGPFFVFTRAILLDRDGDVRRHAAREGLGEEQARFGAHRRAAQSRDNHGPDLHGVALASLRSVDWWFAWQIATATASQASSESIVWFKPSSEWTMSCTCRFSARPYPTTLLFTSSGEYSPIASPASAAISKAM